MEEQREISLKNSAISYYNNNYRKKVSYIIIVYHCFYAYFNLTLSHTCTIM